MSSSGGWNGDSKLEILGMLKSSMSTTSCLPPIGPNLSFERFSITPSMMPCVVSERVVAEKLTTRFECVSGSLSSSPCTCTVLPTPVSPTASRWRLRPTAVLKTNALRTVSTVGTIIFENGSPGRGRHEGTMVSHSSQSPFFTSTKQS